MAHIDRSTTLIRPDHFTVANEDPSHQFKYWKEVTSPLLDVERPFAAGSPESKSPFLLEAKGYNLGKFHFLTSQTGAQLFNHDERHIHQHSADQWTFQYRRKGTLVSRSGERVMQSPAGAISFMSLAYPYSGSTDEAASIHIFLDRESLPHLANRLDRANHMLVGGAIGGLFRDFLTSLEAHLPSLVLSDVPTLDVSLMALVHSLLAQTPRYSLDEHSLIAATLFERSRDYIDANLASPSLSADAIAGVLGVSLRQLYYIFEKQGGIANYIRNRRLIACHKAIASATDLRAIHEIAEHFGLPNRALFSRQFRAQFGYSPREARDVKLLEYMSGAAKPKTFAQWLNQAPSM